MSEQADQGGHSLVDDAEAFDVTPLAEYLDDAGVSDAGMSDWGIDGQEQAFLSDNDDSDDLLYPIDRTQEARLRKRIISGSSKPLPLILSAAGGDPPVMRQQRFRSLIRRAVTSTLSQPETTQFLDRFRYVLVSSQLLEEPAGSAPMWSAKSLSKRRHDILFGDDGPWSTLKMNKKLWVGGGGCLIVVSVLLNWQVKSGRLARVGLYARPQGQSLYQSREAAAGLVIVLCTVLFLFAHSRRRALRMLRAKAVANASHFVHNNRKLDSALSKCLSLIQEVDLLSLGYRPDLADSTFPASRLAHNHSRHARTAKTLRSAVAAALYLSSSSYVSSIKDCIRCCSELDLQRYFDIYGLHSSQDEFGFVMNDDLVGFTREDDWQHDDYFGAQGANASVKKLRYEFHRLQFLRKAFICCLLSVSSTGECTRQELNRWGTVVEDLEQSSGLALQLANTLSKDSLLPTLEEDESLADPAELAPELISAQPVDPSHLNKMAGMLQHIQAGLYLTADAESDPSHYDNLGNNIQELLELWRAGGSERGRPVTSTGRSRHAPSASISTSATLIDVLDEERVLTSKSGEEPGSPLNGLRRPIYGPIRPDSRNSSMTVLEGIVESDVRKKPSGLSREARILQMQQDRETDAQKRHVMRQRENFVLELGSVLDQRRAE